MLCSSRVHVLTRNIKGQRESNYIITKVLLKQIHNAFTENTLPNVFFRDFFQERKQQVEGSANAGNRVYGRGNSHIVSAIVNKVRWKEKSKHNIRWSILEKSANGFSLFIRKMRMLRFSFFFFILWQSRSVKIQSINRKKSACTQIYLFCHFVRHSNSGIYDLATDLRLSSCITLPKVADRQRIMQSNALWTTIYGRPITKLIGSIIAKLRCII